MNIKLLYKSHSKDLSEEILSALTSVQKWYIDFIPDTSNTLVMPALNIIVRMTMMLYLGYLMTGLFKMPALGVGRTEW